MARPKAAPSRPQRPAAAPEAPSQPKSRSKLRLVLLVLLPFILIGGIVGGEYYFYRRVDHGAVVDKPHRLAGDGVVTNGFWSADGKALTLLTSDGRLKRLRIPSMEEEVEVPLEKHRVLKDATFYAGGALLMPEWSLSPEELQRERRPAAPPLSWIESAFARSHGGPALYDTSNGKLLGRLEGGENVHRLFVSPDGMYIAGIVEADAGGGHGAPASKEFKGGSEVRFWNRTGKLKGTFPADLPGTAVAFHPNQDEMAWLHPQKTGMLVTFRTLDKAEKTGQVVAKLASGHLLRYSPDGKRIAVGSKFMELIHWKWEKQIMGFAARPPIEDLTFARDGRMPLTTTEMSGTRAYRILDPNQEKPSPTMRGDWLSPNWTRVAEEKDGNVLVRDLDSGQVIAEYAPHRQQGVLAFSHNGGSFATSEDPGVIVTWDKTTHQVMKKVRGPEGRVLAMNRDWTMAVTQTRSGFTCWSYPSGEVIRAWKPDARFWWDFATIGPDQVQVVFVRRGHNIPAAAFLWDPHDGTTLQLLAPWTATASALSIGGATGNLFAASSGEQWQGYSDADRTLLWLKDAPERALRILSDKDLFYFVGRKNVYAVKAADGHLEEHWVHEGVSAEPNTRIAAISPDGALLATAESDTTNEIVVWNTANGKRFATLRGHTRPACDMMFSPDARTLISLGDDDVLLQWALPAAAAAKGGGH